MDDFEKILAAFGLKLINILAGAGTALVAMQLWKGLETRKERWATFLGGWMLASLGAPPLREWLELKESLEIGLVLILGLFGMALTAEIWKLLKDTEWKELGKLLIDVIRKKFG